MTKTGTVIEAFTHTYGHGGTVEVPAGALVDHAYDETFWVSPLAFPRGSIERHDATYYGIRVHSSNVTLGKEA